MAKPKPKSKRRLWRNLGMTAGVTTVLLLLFVVAFIFNPFEGSLPSLRDAVPRSVNFFVRKERLAGDFDPFPVPRPWPEIEDARGFADLKNGALGGSWKRAGVDRALQQLADTFARVRTDSNGLLDVMRDVIGDELIVAGYELDYSQAPPKPLAEPWWCLYTRINWRVKVAHALAGFGFVQGSLRDGGIDVIPDGADMVVKLQGGAPLFVRRHLDLLMVANHKPLIELSQRLIDGDRDEEAIGRMPAYTDGALARIEEWAEDNRIDEPNVLEFVVEPNAFDGFRRFAAAWPDPQNRDSMNERVLASFLNLKGWLQVTGGVMFADGVLATTGQVGLNSKQHTPFQSSFYEKEEAPRDRWLDPFLRMVPESACAAAALSMPAGEFLHAMFEALEDGEKELINDGMRRATFQQKQLTDMRDLIERMRGAFLDRTGFVFRKNVLDMSRDKNGELMVPVAARSPMPQVAWVFWLRQPGGAAIATELVSMLQTYYTTFGFRGVWHLKVPFGAGQLPEPVTEFTRPSIPATGEIAMIVFSDFFVVSNSGPLIRDILLTRHRNQTGARSVRETPGFDEIERELPGSLSGLVWLHGDNLVSVFDDYIAFAETSGEQPDPEWMRQNRPAAEEQVRRSKFPRYQSIASMPKSMVEPGGEFDVAVAEQLREQWRRERSSFTADDRSQMQQLRAMAQMLKAGCVHLELQNNYIRFQARLIANLR